jgi:thermitase
MRRFALLLVCLTIGQAVAQYGLRGRVAVPQLEYAPGQVVVMFREDVAPIQRAWLRQTAGAQLVKRGRYADYELWQFSPYADMRQVAAQLMRTGWFIAAEPNWRLELADGWNPNDPLYTQQPALPTIGAPQAWALWRGDDRFIMAILDTGARLDHQDLQARLLPGYDFGNDDNDPSDPFGHGTYVTGIAGAVTNNARGVAAVAPHGKILPVKVFTDAGQGYLNDLIDGVNYAVAQGAHAINLSLGNTTTTVGALRDRSEQAWNAGVVIVAAAGNTNSTTPFYPAWYPVCIAVAACNLDGTRSSVSTYGSWVDVAAPSGDVYSTTSSTDNSYSRNRDGYTSYAAPFVTAQAAMLYALVADGPTDRSQARAQAVRELIETTATAVPGNYVAHGMINLQASVQKALTVPVRGRVQIQGYAGSYNGRTVEVVLRPVGGGSALATASGTLNSTRDFEVSFFNYLGYYDLAVRAQGTLLKRVPNARMRYPGVSGLNLTLTPGDVNGDNVIDDADLLQVLFAFGANNPSVDLNGDGVVDDADLLLVLFNFGLQGE